MFTLFLQAHPLATVLTTGADLILLTLKVSLVVSTVVAAILFLDGYYLRWKRKRDLRRRILAGLAGGTTKPMILPASGETTPAIPDDRNHPLYSIGGGRRGPDHSLQGRFR